MAILGGALLAADHIDAPAVTGPNSTSPSNDITDIYAFQSPTDNSRMVFVLNTQGLMSPETTEGAKFGNGLMYEFNIDNTGDNVEDLVIQCLFQSQKMKVYGPVAVSNPGTTSTVLTNGPVADVQVTPYGKAAPFTSTNAEGVKIFAGPRDDPFFFDLAQFKKVIAGSETGFRDPGMDTFAGTNVMSIVVEVPKSMLGSATTINVWGETKAR